MLSGRLESFVRLVPDAEPDGLGGLRVRWAEGETLRLAAVPLRAAVTARAGAPAQPLRMRLLCPGEIRLRMGDRLRRLSTGEVLRVAGDSRHRHTPAGAALPLGEAEAEVVP